MLHMVVISHGPETCAAAHPEIAVVARSGMAQLEAVAQRLGIAIQGFWVDAPGHVSYLVADAPHAHAVSALMAELNFFHWNTVAIHPIQPVAEATAALLAERQP